MSIDGRKRIGQSTVWNWTALAATIGITFVLSPFVVRHLGHVGYGVWTLVNSLIAYMSLLDLGLRGAVTRFVSRYHSVGEHAEASRIVSAALWIRFLMVLLVLAGIPLLMKFAARALQIPQEMQVAAQWAIAVTSISFAVTLTCGVFGGILAALSRFDLLGSINIGQVVVRALGVVWLLSAGHGIVALALWEMVVVFASNGVLVAITLRTYRQLSIVIKRPDKDILRQLWGFSGYIVLIHSCTQVIYYTDNLVVSALLGVEMVAFFAIAGSVLVYARQAVSAIGVTLLPIASSLDASGRRDQLRDLLVLGTRAANFVAMPISIALFFLGRTFVGLWVGPEYAEPSGRVMEILLISQVFVVGSNATYNMIYALNKVRWLSFVVAVEATVNLALSIVLAPKFGLAGVAWGTVIPSLVVHVVVLPRYICSTLEMSLRQHLLQSWIRPAAVVVPFGCACFLASRFWVPATMAEFAWHIALLLPIFGLSFVLILWKEVSPRFHDGLKWCNRRFATAAGIIRRID